MQSKIWVIGDSHARIFSYNNNFIPFFIGEGKRICFVNDDCLSNIIAKVSNIIRKIETGDCILFFLGEPDTRFYLGRGWKPWKKKFGLSFRRRSKIRKSFKRYCQLINEVKTKTDNRLLVLNITPSIRKDQNKLVDYFNKLLTKFCLKDKGVEFISINKNIYNPKTKTVKPEYFGDPVHLNMRVQLLIEEWLIEKGILQISLYDENNKMDKNEIKKHYKFNEQFGCYTL